MINIQPFNCVETITIAASTSTANGAFSSQDNGVNSLVITNPTNSVAFVKWGKGAQTATAANYPILPNTKEVVDMGQSDNVAVILAAGAASGNVYTSRGTGS